MKPTRVLPRKHYTWTAILFWTVGTSLIAAGCQQISPSTPTPVASTTSLPVLEPTSPATSLPSPEPIRSASPLPSPAGGLFFGTIYITPDPKLFGPPFTGAFIMLKPETAIATLEATRAKGVQLFVNLAGKTGHQETGGAFSVKLFKEKLDAFRSIDFAPYVADGTVVGHLLVDEPQDPSNWNGLPLPYKDLEAVAAYSKQLWPTLPVGVYGPPTYLQGGAPWSALEFGVAQYTVKKGDFSTWLGKELDASRQSGLGFVAALSVLRGAGQTKSLTPEQIREWGQTLISQPEICGVILVRYDPTFMQDPTNAPVLADLGQLARQRTAKTCQPAR